MRSIQSGPSSSMKKVRAAIVITATTIVSTLLVIEIAVPERPNTFFAAPPSSTACRTRSTMSYFVWRKPSLPRPLVRSST